MAGSSNFITINFPSQITKIESEIFPGGEITSSGRQSNTAADGDIYTLTCTVENGYKISNCVYSNAGNAELRGFTDTTISLKAGTGGLGGTLDISVAQKAISLSNLQKFKELCDQNYAKIGEGGLTVININTAAGSGTLAADDFAKVQANPAGVVFYGDEDIYQLDSYEESTPYYQYRRIVPNAAKNGFYDNILRIGSGGAWTYTQNTISGGGGSGGTKLYSHARVYLENNNAGVSFLCSFMSTRSTRYTTINELAEDLFHGLCVPASVYSDGGTLGLNIYSESTGSSYLMGATYINTDNNIGMGSLDTMRSTVDPTPL